MTFPLYNNLESEIDESFDTIDLTTRQKTKLLKAITEMDTQGAELVYALIKVYYLKHTQNTDFDLPYNGKYENDCVYFNINDIPFRLKHILLSFINLHLKSMNN